MMILSSYKIDKSTQKAINAVFRRKFLAFVKSVWGSTPFLDKPNKSSYGSSASVGVRTKYPIPGKVTIYGGRPNIARMKGYMAPVDEFVQTDPYTAKLGSHYYSLDRYQKKSENAGPYDDLSPNVYKHKYFAVKNYQGSSVPVGFTLTGKGRASLSYWEETIADWIEKHYSKQIGQILDDAVWEVMSGI